MVFFFGRFMPPWVMGLVTIAYVLVFLPTVLPARISVGHDGIRVRWLGNQRFIAFSSIERATTTPLGIELALVGERKVDLHLTLRDNDENQQRDRLLERITEGRARQHGRARADEEAVLARGTRDVETWIRDLTTLGHGEGAGYRVNAIPRERLWEIVENPAADPSAREGAAVALHGTLDDSGRARLRALANETASPRLRVALDGLGRETEPARLRVALDAAEEEVEDPPSTREATKARAVSGPRRS
jgi:hypothetical protein